MPRSDVNLALVFRRGDGTLRRTISPGPGGDYARVLLTLSTDLSYRDSGPEPSGVLPPGYGSGVRWPG